MRKIVAAFVAVLVASLTLACGSPEAKRAEAASSYAAQQADCIATNYFREDIDACRDRVKKAWAKTDGGVPAEGGAK